MRRVRLSHGVGIVVVVVAAVVVLMVSSFLGVSVVWAEDVISSQAYVSVMGLDTLKAQGFDGSGVTIAVIDGNVDLTVPELVGADIDVKAACTSKGAFHGTSVISDLANSVWGWAPKAHFLAYGANGLVSDAGVDEATRGCGGGMDDMIQRAITDGADIINISAGIGPDSYTLARAAMRGIPIITGSGNLGKYGDGLLSPYNSVVIVGATDMAGQRSEYSQYGTGLTVMAPADPDVYRLPDEQGNLTRIVSGDGGTSTATPMVTGALALAMQKWPDANGNQLIASLIATSDRAGQWDEYYGWGMVDPAGLISNDPSQYSTVNPLMDAIPGAELTHQDYEDYVNGTVEFPENLSPYDTDYTPAASAGPTPGGDASVGVPGWVLPLGVGLVIVLAGVVVIVVVMSRRRSRVAASSATTSPVYPYPAQAYGPPPGYPQGYPQGYSQNPPQGYGYPQPSPPGYPQGTPPQQQPQTQSPPGWVPPPSSYPGGPHA